MASEESRRQVAEALLQLASSLEELSSDDLAVVVAELKRSSLPPEALQKLTKLAAKASGYGLLQSFEVVYHF